MKTLRIAALSAIAALGTFSSCTPVKEEVKPDLKQNLPPPPPPEMSAKERFEQGVAAFDAGKLDEARTAFLKVSEKVPGNAVVHYNLGVIAERQGSVVDAQRYYEETLKLDPKHRPALLNLGKVYRLQDKFEEAIALYEGALKDPANEFDVALNNNLTVAYRLAKKFDRAEATARKVLSRTKDNPDAYKNLALIYFDQGNYRLAEFISANARKLDDKDPGVYNNLGLIYLKLDDRRLALGQFKKAVELNQNFAPSLFNIGAIALTYRDYDSAEKVLSKATELDPGSYDGFLAYAFALDGQKARDTKKGQKAGELFEKVLSIKANQPDAICGAAWAYASEKSGWDKALQFFERCKALPSTSAQDQQVIDAKVKGIVAMQKAPAAAPPAEKEKPKATTPTGPSMLDKVSDDAAAKDVQGAAEAPAGEAKPAEKAPEAKPAAPAPETKAAEKAPEAAPAEAPKAP
jgi:tetratricopeptide (TPR) repeat protein